MNIKKLALILVAGAVGLFLLIQLIPFGHNRMNPPTVSEPQWSKQPGGEGTRQGTLLPVSQQ